MDCRTLTIDWDCRFPFAIDWERPLRLQSSRTTAEHSIACRLTTTLQIAFFLGKAIFASKPHTAPPCSFRDRPRPLLHALWFIRNTVKFSICLFPIFSKNGYMIVAYLLLNFLVNLSMVFLSNSSHSGCIRTSQEVCGT